MIGVVIDFSNKHWRVQTDNGVKLLKDWQCRTGMVPGKRVVLTYNSATRHWHASEESNEDTRQPDTP